MGIALDPMKWALPSYELCGVQDGSARLQQLLVAPAGNRRPAARAVSDSPRLSTPFVQEHQANGDDTTDGQ